MNEVDDALFKLGLNVFLTSIKDYSAVDKTF